MFVHETERMRPVAEDDDDTTHGTGTPVGAAEGAVGLLLFFADMVFSRGLHVALSLSTDIL